ncbi:MAG: McrB family protein [Saprospiraceae bacterium]
MTTLPDLISQYTSILKTEGLADEAYKWELLEKQKGRPDLEAVSLPEELKQIDFSNLLYYNSRKQLLDFVDSDPIKMRETLNQLVFGKQSLSDRIEKYKTASGEILVETSSGKKLSNYQDERTAASLLAFKDPANYTFFTSTLQMKVCEALGVPRAKASKRYEQYLDLLKNIVLPAILESEELLSIYTGLVPNWKEVDPNRLLLAQDLMYRMLIARKNEGRESLPSSKQAWMYAPGRRAENWELNYNEGNMTIGWDHLGDLSKFKSQDEITEKLVELDKPESKPTNKSKACWEFYDSIEPGALVFAKNGQKELVGLGRVLSDYRYDPSRAKYSHVRDVEWLKIGSWFPGYELPLKTLTDWTDYPDAIKGLLNLFDQTETHTKSLNMPHPLNQILYGPPGTGKTYATRQRAVEICNGSAPADRKKLKEEYEALVKAGRIVFTTFHQSMSYEDFVEGIKPETKDGEISYIEMQGIFTLLAEDAEQNLRLSKQEGGLSKEHNPINLNSNTFEEAYDLFWQDLLTVERIELPTSTGRPFAVQQSKSGNLRLVTFPSAKVTGTLTQERLLRHLNGENIDPAWLIYYWGVLYHLKDHYGLNLSEYAAQEAPRGQRHDSTPIYRTTDLSKEIERQNYVLIIDEINRGNTPAIFGELITLLEADKRLGADEELTVTLPYSKEPFGVPNNLYVIGTMNTADRSVEALDAALRRRFEFDYVGPKPEVLAEVPPSGEDPRAPHGTGKRDRGYITLADGSQLYLPDFLILLNQRIEALRDRDHTIGHAPFFKVHDATSLGRVLAKNVIPLLQEYFYGDDAQLARILGKGFVEELKDQVTFATSGEDDPDLPTRYTVHDPSVKGFALADALRAGGFSVTEED